MSDYTPIILIELVLVFGGALLFAWWQLHSIKVDQRKAAQKRAREAAAAATPAAVTNPGADVAGVEGADGAAQPMPRSGER